MLDIEKIRQDFPILTREVYGKPLVYLDNAATSQKPRCVIDTITDGYTRINANVHRGVHRLSQESTDGHEHARRRVQQFLNAASDREIIFTRGTTESINLVAHSFGQAFLHDGDEVIISEMEHHANIVPWQLLQETRHIRLRVIPIDDRGVLDMEAFAAAFNERPGWSPSPMSRMYWARSIPSRRLSTWPTGTRYRYSSTGAQVPCTTGSTCRLSMSTSM